jgi:hypothetical protein
MGRLRGRGRALRGGIRREWLPLGLAGGGLIVGGRLLSGTFTLFQHAYVGTYWALPGAQVSAAYWASVRFAFEETVLVACGTGILVAVTVAEVYRALRR